VRAGAGERWQHTLFGWPASAQLPFQPRGEVGGRQHEGGDVVDQVVRVDLQVAAAATW
jgi:hypothetical protein